ncbi:hypothetical protein [Carnobacterium mobile]|nr:hypothetical protein [Carnobacterium mobile]
MENEKNDFSIWGALFIVLGMIVYVIFKSPILLIIGILRFILIDIKE